MCGLSAIEILGKSCIDSFSISRTNITPKIVRKLDISHFVRTCVSESNRYVSINIMDKGYVEEHTYSSEVNHW